MNPKHDILITVKTYPKVSKGYRETVCTAGIRKDTREMIRIYPIPFRYLKGKHQFSKYQWISAVIHKRTQDVRPESYIIEPDTIELKEHIGTKNDWNERCSWILKSPHVFNSVEVLQEAREHDKTSLGVVKPAEITGFKIKSKSAPELEELNKKKDLIFSQMDLFEDIKDLEIIPYKFVLQFKCSDARCNGHEMSILDWEFAQLYRNMKYQKDWKEKIEKKMQDICDKKRDTYLFFGNMAQRHHIFCILGFFYPPHCRQLQLF